MGLNRILKRISGEKNKILQLAEKILDLLFPPRCAFCDEILSPGQKGICADCLEKLPLIREPFCMKCGKMLAGGEKEYCGDCEKNRHLFYASRAVLGYDERVRRSIYRFKYSGRKEYAKAYAALAGEQLADWIGSVNPDAIVPVPLHRSRYRRRGYNQSQLLAKELAKLTGCPLEDGLVIRAKKTRPQKRLDLAGREENLKKAFKIRRNDVKLNRVLLVDDIYTTGSTMDAVTECLTQVGVKRVYGLTIAVGQPRGGTKNAGEELQEVRKTV